MPLIVFWLIAGSLFFTLPMKFINFRAFIHAIQVVRGKYDNPKDLKSYMYRLEKGEFQIHPVSNL